ncbi:MAG TPA: NAD(P)/FAD-dependent oxidoreductase, partial [Thermoanaerobaculia bacterium]|nr:NAD(P)/FAD-dependent oxidoreductase [Thermoanaerobaculia bacterium]
VVGGANSAGQAAMHFARFARRVVMLVRGSSLSKSMSQYLIDQIGKTPNIEVLFGAEVAEVHGGASLEELSIRQGADGRRGLTRVPASSLFIFIGAEPRTAWLEGIVERDEHGFLLAGPDLPREESREGREGRRPRGWPLDREPFLLEASVPGVFVAGDVRHGSIKRVASGVGEGAIAVSFVHRYLSDL